MLHCLLLEATGQTRGQYRKTGRVVVQYNGVGLRMITTMMCKAMDEEFAERTVNGNGKKERYLDII